MPHKKAEKVMKNDTQAILIQGKNEKITIGLYIFRNKKDIHFKMNRILTVRVLMQAGRSIAARGRPAAE